MLILPHLKETKRANTRVTTTARVLTTDEHRNMVKSKLEAAEATAARKLKRRQEAEMKKKAKETKLDKKQRPQKQTKVIPTSSRSSKRLQNVPRKDYARVVAMTSQRDSDEEEEHVCAKCNSEEPEGESERIDWIQCKWCEEWYHVECEDPENPDDNHYICKKCLKR